MKKSADDLGRWSDPFWTTYWAQWPACYSGNCDLAAVAVTVEKPQRFHCWEHREESGAWRWMEAKDRRF